MPTPEQISGWSPAQLIQWILVTVLIGVGMAAFYGMKALSKSNDAVNQNYDRSLTMWESRFKIQDDRHDAQDKRAEFRDANTQKLLADLSLSMRSISDSVRLAKRSDDTPAA